jgi:hypothetical protein
MPATLTKTDILRLKKKRDTLNKGIKVIHVNESKLEKKENKLKRELCVIQRKLT